MVGRVFYRLHVVLLGELSSDVSFSSTVSLRDERPEIYGCTIRARDRLALDLAPPSKFTSLPYVAGINIFWNHMK